MYFLNVKLFRLQIFLSLFSDESGQRATKNERNLINKKISKNAQKNSNLEFDTVLNSVAFFEEITDSFSLLSYRAG